MPESDGTFLFYDRPNCGRDFEDSLEVDIAVIDQAILDWNNFIGWDRFAPSSVAIPSGYGLTLFESQRFVNPTVTAFNAYEKYVCVEWTEVVGNEDVLSGDVVDAQSLKAWTPADDPELAFD